MKGKCPIQYTYTLIKQRYFQTWQKINKIAHPFKGSACPTNLCPQMGYNPPDTFQLHSNVHQTSTQATSTTNKYYLQLQYNSNYVTPYTPLCTTTHCHLTKCTGASHTPSNITMLPTLPQVALLPMHPHSSVRQV